jgi:hypothetical protein
MGLQGTQNRPILGHHERVRRWTRGDAYLRSLFIDHNRKPLLPVADGRHAMNSEIYSMYTRMGLRWIRNCSHGRHLAVISEHSASCTSLTTHHISHHHQEVFTVHELHIAQPTRCPYKRFDAREWVKAQVQEGGKQEGPPALNHGSAVNSPSLYDCFLMLGG